MSRVGTRPGAGEGSIYQRQSDDRWVAMVDLGWQNGRRHRKPIYGRTRKEVADKLREALAAQERGSLVADERQTVGEYLRWWLKEVVENSVRPSTAASYEATIKNHVLPDLGRVRLAKLTPAHVQTLLNAKLKAGLSPRSVQYLHAILRHALHQAERWGLVPRNVAALVSPPRVVRDEVVPLTPEEARALLDAAAGDRLEALYSVALAVGLRQGEALALRWADVDLDAGTLRVRRTVKRLRRPGAGSGQPRTELVFSEPKSARSRRTVALPQTCIEALRAHRRRQLEERLGLGQIWQDNDLVFPTPLGTVIDARNLIRHFDRLCEQAGVGKRRFHDLRHTCASLLLAQGVHARVAMEVLGHSQIGLTLNTYSHVMPLLQRDAADRMDLALGR